MPAAGAADPGTPTEDDERATEGGRGISAATIAEAEKLVGVDLTADERALIVETIAEDVSLIARRQGIELSPEGAPALTLDLPAPPPAGGTVVRLPAGAPPALPADDASIAFAPVTDQARWLRAGAVTSERLTRLALERLRRIGPRLECVVTLLEDRALASARRADAEAAAGRWRSPLHGIPWGAKDLLDAAGGPTTWGATPYRDRRVDRDAFVVRRLEEAGAVLTAKLTLGALAYGDIWFGGRTRSPWNLERGSSGSSAGSAAATAAGLVGFTLGTETYGSIVSPCMRCGTTGLRPTFGRVARTGAMALCWSLDKIGPITRTVDDAALVLGVINGADAGDPSSVDAGFVYDGSEKAAGRTVGYDPRWFEDGHALDHAALDALRDAGVRLVEVTLPDWPYDTLQTILRVEAAAAFDELTRSDRDDELVWQDPDAWPNLFRRSRFTPAIEYVQTDRFRRRVATMMEARFAEVDAMISPSFAASLLLITNCTGHPSLTLRTGFRDERTPHGITLWGRLYDEATLCAIGRSLEARLGVWDRRPGL